VRNAQLKTFISGQIGAHQSLANLPALLNSPAGSNGCARCDKNNFRKLSRLRRRERHYISCVFRWELPQEIIISSMPLPAVQLKVNYSIPGIEVYFMIVVRAFQHQLEDVASEPIAYHPVNEIDDDAYHNDYY